jgi:hypothetical protein
MTSWATTDVLLGPFAHHLTLCHLDSPVYNNIEAEALLDVAEDGLAVTETVAAHVTPTHVVLARCLVFCVRDESVASSKDGIVSEDTTHGLGVIRSHLVNGAWSLSVIFGVWAIVSLLP